MKVEKVAKKKVVEEAKVLTITEDEFLKAAAKAMSTLADKTDMPSIILLTLAVYTAELKHQLFDVEEE